jgi:uncharacterized phiE125 gp8 family phage protein
MNYALRLITAPAEEPITLTLARTHVKAQTTAEDALLQAWITAAREQAEAFIGRALITQTWDMSFDAFGCGEIDIPLPPLQSVTFVKYYDEAGVEQTLATSSYHVDSRSVLGRVVLDDAASWPSTDVRPNAVTIRFVCGYGLAAAVPQSIKAAMLLMLTDLDQHRGEVVTGASVQQIPRGAEALLSPYKIVRF